MCPYDTQSSENFERPSHLINYTHNQQSEAYAGFWRGGGTIGNCPPFPKANTYLYIQPAVLNCLKGVKGTVLISVVEPVQS